MKRALPWAIGCLVGCLTASSPALATETITYTYDELGRLVTLATTGTVNNGEGVTVSYDEAGNRITYSVSGA